MAEEDNEAPTPAEAREWFENLNRNAQIAILAGEEEPPDPIAENLKLSTELKIEKVAPDGERETVVDTRDGISTAEVSE